MVLHSTWAPIGDARQSVVASLVTNLQSAVAGLMASNVLLATNSYDACESFGDRMDSTRVAVVAFDAYLHRFVFRALAFALNHRMEIVSLTTMMIWMMMRTMMVLKYCHGLNVKWAARFSVVLVMMTYCALQLMNSHRRNCYDVMYCLWMNVDVVVAAAAGGDGDGAVVVVLVRKSNSPVSNCLIYMILRKQLLCHCGHRDLTYCHMMVSLDLMCVAVAVFVLIQYNLKDCNHRAHRIVFVLKFE